MADESESKAKQVLLAKQRYLSQDDHKSGLLARQAAELEEKREQNSKNRLLHSQILSKNQSLAQQNVTLAK